MCICSFWVTLFKYMFAIAIVRDAGTTQPAASSSSEPLAATGTDADIVESLLKSHKSGNIHSEALYMSIYTCVVEL